MHHDSLKAADGGTFVALLIGAAVANITSSHPPKTIIKIVFQGKVNAAPCSCQKAT